MADYLSKNPNTINYMYTTNRNNIRKIIIIVICCVISCSASTTNNIKYNKQVSNSQKNTVKSIDKYKPAIVKQINNLMKDTILNECLDYDDYNNTMFVKSSVPKRRNLLSNFIITSKLKPAPRPNIKVVRNKPKNNCNIKFL